LKQEVLLKGGRNISFNIEDFKDFTSYLKQNFLYSAKEVSKTSSGDSLIENEEISLLSLDKVTSILKEKYPLVKPKCDYCIVSNDEHCVCTSLENLSTDGLYINLINGHLPELYFVEFKKWDIYNPDNSYGKTLKSINELLNDIDMEITDLSYLEKIKQTLIESKKKIRSENRLKIILKSFESLFCVLPNLYEIYCVENNVVGDVQDFKSFISKCPIEYIIVYEQVEEDLSEHIERVRMESSCENNLFQLQRYRPHPFNEVRMFGVEEDFINFIKDISA